MLALRWRGVCAQSALTTGNCPESQSRMLAFSSTTSPSHVLRLSQPTNASEDPSDRNERSNNARSSEIEVSDPLKSLGEVCKPDERQEFLVQSPGGVQQLFETAKNARLYTYYVYRFHQLAEMTAYLALERALKERWNSEVAGLPSIDDQDFDAPGLSGLLGVAVARGWIRKGEFSSRRYRAHVRIMSERSNAAILAMQKSGAQGQPIAEPSEEELRSVAERIDVARLLAEHLPDLRNQLAHGSARLSPTSDLVLSDVCDAINMIFDGTPPIDSPNDKQDKQPGLHKIFKAHVRELEANQELFAKEFAAAKVRIRSMQVRYVEEKDPIRQALLEIYVSVVHGTPYNDFDTH